MLLDVDVAKKLDSNWIDYNLGLLVWELSYDSLRDASKKSKIYVEFNRVLYRSCILLYDTFLTSKVYIFKLEKISD